MRKAILLIFLLCAACTQPNNSGYMVEYRLPGQWCWRTIEQVKGDGIIEHNKARYIILEDETRMEIPITAEFRFSKERFRVILQNMKDESGQPIVTR